MEFKKFKIAVQKQFKHMQSYPFFTVDMDKDLLYDTYLNSFPPGTNELYKNRREYDCSACKQFIRTIGNLVAIKDNILISIWDVETEDYFVPVAAAMSTLVKSLPIDNVFLHYENHTGTDKNIQLIEGSTITWEHLFVNIPREYYCSKDNIGTKLGESRTNFEVLYRGLNELTVDALQTVLELISQKSAYRIEEHLHAVNEFYKLKKLFDKSLDKKIFCWSNIKNSHAVIRFRNTVIGTLVEDLSKGVDLEEAVKSFELKVAPANYKRPKSLITKSMIEAARKKLDELGYTSALDRRYAILDDISINNIIFADRVTRKTMDAFDELLADTPEDPKKFDRVDSIPIETFIKDVLPLSTSIELMLENDHKSNMMSLIAPVDATANNMFKWSNNFSWSYAGEFTDSIKERVKSAGGIVNAYLRCSLSWNNLDDLDLHLVEPDGHEIFFANKNRVSELGGMLDVDMNAHNVQTREPVENICYVNNHRMKFGVYKLFVNQYNPRESSNIGFQVDVEFDGIVHSYYYKKSIDAGKSVKVVDIAYSKTGISLVEHIPSIQSSQEVWGLNTKNFHRVNLVMYSPNYWDEKSQGNKHYFFILDGCNNPEESRGFYNEFLKPELDTHRKVFETLGSKMRVPVSDNQLSGLGFSSTNKDSIYCRVTGKITRVMKIIF